jgi:hypothetical protein
MCVTILHATRLKNKKCKKSLTGQNNNYIQQHNNQNSTRINELRSISAEKWAYFRIRTARNYLKNNKILKLYQKQNKINFK